jgi:hypothetical protein
MNLEDVMLSEIRQIEFDSTCRSYLEREGGLMDRVLVLQAWKHFWRLVAQQSEYSKRS